MQVAVFKYNKSSPNLKFKLLFIVPSCLALEKFDVRFDS